LHVNPHWKKVVARCERKRREGETMVIKNKGGGKRSFCLKRLPEAKKPVEGEVGKKLFTTKNEGVWHENFVLEWKRKKRWRHIKTGRMAGTLRSMSDRGSPTKG